jgi:membrane peptidoglycan carboxypeptidase
LARNFATRRLLRNRLRNGSGHGHAGGIGIPWYVQTLIGVIGLGLIALSIGAGTTYGVYRYYANGVKSPAEVIASQPSGGAQVFDRNGKLLYEYIDDRSGLRSPVKLENISPYLIAATISTEDYSYWTNEGVNLRGLARAGLEQAGLRDADAGATTGGSSITQQLVKNIYIPQEDRAARSYKRKLKETIYALELTDNYSKDQILEWYLNQISYGGIYNGVEAASMGYFGKPAKDLNLPEAALLAGIPAYPSAYEPINNPQAAIERRNEVLRLMRTRDKTTLTEDGKEVPGYRFRVNENGDTIDLSDTAFYLATLSEPAIVPQRFPVQAPHWVFNQIQPQIEALYGPEALYRGGLRITTTLDLDMQAKGHVALETWISEYENSAQGHNGALVAMDPRTSEVLVYIGSRDYFSDQYFEDCDCVLAGRNDNAGSENSPGSTLKPFTYAAAFENLGWGPETEILDTPISYPDADGEPFTPRNPSGNFVGPVSVRNALGNSLNIPAFKTALYVGVDDVVAEYKKFGMTTLDDKGFGPSVTLGGVDVSLVDVTYAYTVLASGGKMRGTLTSRSLDEGNRKLDPVSILQITRQDGTVLYPDTPDHRVQVKEEEVISPQTAFQINNILSDPSAFCITYGCGALSIGRTWGVKTGTSEPFEESKAIGETWTYGYTPELVAGVWAGNSDNSPMFNILSTSISYRAVRDFMIDALEETPASTFERPGGLTNIDTCTPSGLKATPACGRKVKNLLPEETAPKKDDDWWKRVKIDIRDGLLATELTPPQFIQERFGLAIPEGVEGFARSQAQEWQKYLSAQSAPTERSTGSAPIAFLSPRNGAALSGIIQISGKADDPNFLAYRVEYGAGSPPLAWTTILRSEVPQPGGGLALWKVDDLEPGTYTLRLVMETKDRGELSTFVTVTVGAGASPGRTPRARTPTSGGFPSIDRTPTVAPTIDLSGGF